MAHFKTHTILTFVLCFRRNQRQTRTKNSTSHHWRDRSSTFLLQVWRRETSLWRHRNTWRHLTTTWCSRWKRSRTCESKIRQTAASGVISILKTSRRCLWATTVQKQGPILLNLFCRNAIVVKLPRFWCIIWGAQLVFKWTYLHLLLRTRSLSSWQGEFVDANSFCA